MPVGGALALTAIIAVASAGLVITQRRGAGWRRIVAVALLVWLAVAGVMVLWELIAAVAGKRAYFGAIQVPLSARNYTTESITLGLAIVSQTKKRRGSGNPGARRQPPWSGPGRPTRLRIVGVKKAGR
jgi:hypothetical protein